MTLYASVSSSKLNLCIASRIFSLNNGAQLRPFQSVMVLDNSVKYLSLGVVMHDHLQVASSLFKRFFTHLYMLKYIGSLKIFGSSVTEVIEYKDSLWNKSYV